MGLREANDAVQQLFAKMMNDINREENERTYAAAQKDPHAYRHNVLMERGKSTSYHYYQGKKTRTKNVRYCYSKHRNCAGYYLAWVETWTGRDGKRTAIMGHETKQAAMEWCRWRLALEKKKG